MSIFDVLVDTPAKLPEANPYAHIDFDVLHGELDRINKALDKVIVVEQYLNYQSNIKQTPTKAENVFVNLLLSEIEEVINEVIPKVALESSAALEGLVGTMKNYIVKIWESIYNALTKVLGKLKSLVGLDKKFTDLGTGKVFSQKELESVKPLTLPRQDLESYLVVYEDLNGYLKKISEHQQSAAKTAKAIEPLLTWLSNIAVDVTKLSEKEVVDLFTQSRKELLGISSFEYRTYLLGKGDLVIKFKPHPTIKDELNKLDLTKSTDSNPTAAAAQAYLNNINTKLLSIGIAHIQFNDLAIKNVGKLLEATKK